MIDMRVRNLFAVLLVVALSACASVGDSSGRSQEIDVYERHAGAAETWVRFSSIRNWWAVGFHSVVLEMGRGRHYLVRLMGACDVKFNSGVSLQLVTSRRNVLSDFDRVVAGGQSCQVQSIHRLDYDAVKAELEARGEPVPEGTEPAAVESEDQSSGGT